VELRPVASASIYQVFPEVLATTDRTPIFSRQENDVVRWSYQIGRLFGFPIKIHLSLMILFLITLLQGGGWIGIALTAAIFASVLAHELGHAWAARRLGITILDISLYPFGGMARIATPPKTSRDEIQVAIMGPLTSLVLAAGCSTAGLWFDRAWLSWLAQINWMMGLFNLLPALPMDGGRILRAILARKFGFYTATAWSARLTRYLALALSVAAFWTSLWLLVLSALLLFLSLAEQGSAKIRQLMGDPGYQDLPHPRPVWPAGNHPPPGESFRVPGTDWEVLDPK
jgi:Zn-dependent protease